jgi:hypothetical protein
MLTLERLIEMLQELPMSTRSAPVILREAGVEAEDGVQSITYDRGEVIIEVLGLERGIDDENSDDE